MSIENIVSILKGKALNVDNEKILQGQIEALFKNNDVKYVREYRLDNNNILDFFVDDNLGIEIKIKGNAKKIYYQCQRYCQYPAVKSLLLVTNRSMGFPDNINEKPCYVFKLGQAWL